MWLFGILFACQSTKNVEESFGEALRTQLQIDEPNIVVDKSGERLYVVRNGDFLTIDDDMVYWDISLGTVPEGHKMSEETIYDRRYLRNRLKELGKDNIEITAFRSGEPNKENPLYEVSRVIEYAINGAVMTSNIQVLSIIYNLCVTLIANFHLTPSENMEKFIDKVEDLKKEQQKMEDLENLKDLEF